MSHVSRREARRAAVFMLFQWDVTGRPLGSLYEGEVDSYTRQLADAVTEHATVLDEAVTLAKRYASEDAGRLVNGILGKLVREEQTK